MRSNFSARQSAKRTAIMLLAACGVSGMSAASALGATFVYTHPAADSTENWSSGVNWSPTAPVSATDTTLQFGGVLATPQVVNVTGADAVSNNDITANFQLNQLVASFRGLSTNTTPNNITPTMTISGLSLSLVQDAGLDPVFNLRSNANSGGTNGQKVLITISNDLNVSAPTLTINAFTNFVGGTPVVEPAPGTGVAGPMIKLTGALTWATAGAHTLTFGGDETATADAGATSGRNLFAGNINNESGGGVTSLVKNGTSFWELTGTNGYTGTTTINNGTIRVNAPTGLGTGAVTVASGGEIYLSGAGTYGNAFTISGTGPGGFGALRLGKDAIVSSATTVTVSGDSVIGGTAGSVNDLATIDAQVTGTGNVTFGSGQPTQPTMTINNSANNYVGNTTLRGDLGISTGSSTSAGNFRLGNSNVLPAGTLTMAEGNRSNVTLDMRGNSEGVNALISSGAALLGRVITNGSVASTSASVLTVGENDGSGTWRGSITGTSAKTVGITKVGNGTQVIAGTSSHFGATTITGGTFTVNYNLYSASQTGAPSNYYSVNSPVVLNGGTLAFINRDNGSAVNKTGTTTREIFTVTGGDLSGLMVGQLTDLVTSGAVPIYIAGLDPVAGTVVLSAAPSPTTPTAINTTALVAGITSQTLKSLDLAANSGLDFGTIGSLALTITANPTQSVNGSVLTINNWSGSTSGGGPDQFLVNQADPTAFATAFDQSEIVFTGYGPGYQIIDNGANFEIVPVGVPEPASLGVLGLGAVALLRRRRRD